MKLIVVVADVLLVVFLSTGVVGQLFDDAVPSGSYNDLIDDVLHADDYAPYYQQPSYNNYYQQQQQQTQQQQPAHYAAQPYYSQQSQQQQASQYSAQPYYSQQSLQQQPPASPYYSQQTQYQQQQQQALPDYSLTQLAHVDPSVEVSQGQGFDLYVAEFDAYNDAEANQIIQTLLHQLEQQENVRFTRSIRAPSVQQVANGGN